MLVASVGSGWPDVAIALVALVSPLFTAYWMRKLHLDIRTPSKKPLGELTEAAYHGVLGNNYRLQTLTNGDTGPEVSVAQEHERQAAKADPAGAPPEPASPTTYQPGDTIPPDRP